jgi:hypothetical protein
MNSAPVPSDAAQLLRDNVPWQANDCRVGRGEIAPASFSLSDRTRLSRPLRAREGASGIGHGARRLIDLA